MEVEISRFRFQSLDSLDKFCVEIPGIDQFEEGPFRIGVGHHHAADNLRSILQRDAKRFAVLDENAFHRRVRLQRCAARPRRRRQGLRDTTHAALDQADILRGAKMGTLDVGVTPRAARSGRIANVVSVDKGRAHRFGLEEFADQVAHARQQQALEEFLVIRPGQPVGDLRDRRRRRQEIRINQACRAFPKLDPPRVIRRVASGEPRDLLLCLLNAIP